jgi:hypothetical protein
MTCVLNTDVFGNLTVDLEAVIDKQLLAGIDGDECVNEYAIARLDCLAVGCAGMVKETGAVSAATSIDYTTVGEAKYERMPSIRSLAGGCASPTGYLALVLDEPLAGGEGLQRKKSLAMH